MSRALTIINILLGGVIIVILAAITADVLGRRLNSALVSMSADRGKPAPGAASPARVEDLAFYAPILVNGLFGKGTQGPLTPLVNTPAAQGAAAPSDLLLLGTAVGSFRETFALVRNSAKQEERVFRLGDMVYEAGRLVEVTRERAFIVAGGRKVELLTPTALSASAQAQPANAQGGVPVANMGGGNFVIDQRALNAALDNPAQAMSDARLLPSMKEGKVEGFRVSEVKSGGVFAMVGMKNGDVLLRLNDFPVDSPDKALQSFIALKGQSKLKLDLIRDGQPATFNYDIR